MKPKRSTVSRSSRKSGKMSWEGPASAGNAAIDEELDALAPVRTTVAKTSRRPAFLNLRTILIVILSVTLVVLGVILADRFIQYRRADQIYRELSDSLFTEHENDPSVLAAGEALTLEGALFDYRTALMRGTGEGEGSVSGNSGTVDIQYARIHAMLEQLRQENPDVFGWIVVDGTSINYPVTIGIDNDYYLSHAYNGDYLRSGTIFADWRCSQNMENNRNLVLYGHNMANHSMFGTLRYYKYEDVFYGDNLIYFYTLDGTYVYEPVVIMETHSSFPYFQTVFSSDSDYLDFLRLMLDSAELKKEGTVLSTSDRLITLSTCNNRTVTGRLFLQGRLIRIDNHS